MEQTLRHADGQVLCVNKALAVSGECRLAARRVLFAWQAPWAFIAEKSRNIGALNANGNGPPEAGREKNRAQLCLSWKEKEEWWVM